MELVREMFSNSADFDSLMDFLQSNFTNVYLGSGKLWLLAVIAFATIAIVYVTLNRLENVLRSTDNMRAFIYKVQDEAKLLNEIHICSTLAHEANNINRCVSLLMESPSAVNIPREPFGFTPFLNACWAGCKPLVRFMLLNGADVNRKTKDGDSPLYLAVRAFLQDEQPDIQLFLILIQAGANVNEANFNGFSPLHLAASAGNLEITKWLIVHGADCELKNSSGKTAMQLAQAAGHTAVAQQLSSLTLGSRRKK